MKVVKVEDQGVLLIYLAQIGGGGGEEERGGGATGQGMVFRVFSLKDRVYNFST